MSERLWNFDESKHLSVLNRPRFESWNNFVDHQSASDLVLCFVWRKDQLAVTGLFPKIAELDLVTCIVSVDVLEEPQVRSWLQRVDKPTFP